MNHLTLASKLTAIASTSVERREHVYIANSAAAEPFAVGVARQLASDPRNLQARDADTAYYVTTLYFDSANHDIAHACASDDENVKLRAREYFDRTVENEITSEPLLWFEIKARVGASTRKLRFPIPTSEVGAFLEDGLITERIIELQSRRQHARDPRHRARILPRVSGRVPRARLAPRSRQNISTTPSGR
jgi:hypothetical protein